jgi:plastocyanin
MIHRWALGVVAVVAGACALTGSAAAATVGVSVGNYYFDDATPGDGRVTAQVGDQLRFTVVGGAGHTVTVDALGIDSGQLPLGATFVTPVLTTPGNYTLYCRPHLGRNHVATLVVLGSAATTTVPPTSPPVTTVPGATTVPPATVPGATTVPGAVAPGATTTSTPTGDPVDGVDGPTGSAVAGESVPGSTDVDGELLPVGVVTPDGTPWLRSVWVALVALAVMIVVVSVAVRVGERRHRESLRID